MTFTCRGCGREVFTPENPSEHAPDCPNIKRFREKEYPQAEYRCVGCGRFRFSVKFDGATKPPEILPCEGCGSLRAHWTVHLDPDGKGGFFGIDELPNLFVTPELLRELKNRTQ